MANDATAHIPHVRRHLRLLNVLARLFGLSAIAAGLAFGAWAAFFLLRPELPHPVRTVSRSIVLDYVVAGAFCVVMGSALVAVRPYRLDFTVAVGTKRSWWTGEPPR